MKYVLVVVGLSLGFVGLLISLFAMGALLFWCGGYPVTPTIHACEMQFFSWGYRGMFIGILGGCLAGPILLRRPDLKQEGSEC